MTRHTPGPLFPRKDVLRPEQERSCRRREGDPNPPSSYIESMKQTIAFGLHVPVRRAFAAALLALGLAVPGAMPRHLQAAPHVPSPATSSFVARSAAALSFHQPFAPSVQDASQFERGAASVALRFRRLDGVKRVLMIGAHPDDEDTGLLAALARGRGVETAYLSLSRGEGGQNLIGPRLGEGLGIVRTGELVAARGLDGGRQYFTRAFDFGYSKTLDEALRHWPLDEVLRDVVFVVRAFRPHVIVSVFSGTPRDRHGQHQVAGVAAHEAFEAAGDSGRFPELAEHGMTPWTPLKLYQSVRFSPQDATLRVPTGDFDPVLGMSHFQLAMASRSRHRSQDMGAPQIMGPQESPLLLVASRVEADDDTGLFAGIDTTLAGQLPDPLPSSWPSEARARLGAYRTAVADARRALAADRTDGAVPGLLRAAHLLDGLVRQAPPGATRRMITDRLALVSETALAAASVVMEVRADRSLVVPGESVGVDVIVWNGGRFALEHVAPSLNLPEGWSASRATEAATDLGGSFFFRNDPPKTPADGKVPPASVARWSWRATVAPETRPSAPYFLEQERSGDLYAWPADPKRWAAPFDSSLVRATISLGMEPAALPAPSAATARARLEVRREASYAGLDKAFGEYREHLLATPALDVGVQPKTMAWPLASTEARTFVVTLANLSAVRRTGRVRLETSADWQVEPASGAFALEPGGASQSFAFRVAPSGPAPEGRHDFRAVAEDASGALYSGDYDIVAHPHVRRAALHGSAVARISAFALAADTGLRVGYVMGSGDAGAEALRQAGMQVDLLEDAQLRKGAFDGYDVLVAGVRAYETRPELGAANDAVLAFARAGGTVVVQYNKYEYPQGAFAPYPVRINRPHDRVVDETARVTVLAPGTPVFDGPNVVGPADFEGWVQERGLYFLGDWDSRFTPVLEMADPGEAPKRGGLLVAPVGDGLYVYTGLAFFRQFPAGVPGAFRLFANLASMRAADWHRANARQPAGANPAKTRPTHLGRRSGVPVPKQPAVAASSDIPVAQPKRP